jgi:hypothetical protein
MIVRNPEKIAKDASEDDDAKTVGQFDVGFNRSYVQAGIELVERPSDGILTREPDSVDSFDAPARPPREFTARANTRLASSSPR